MAIYVPGKLTLRQQYVGTDDPDAAAYITAVEAADGQSLETAVQVAIHSFVKGCKADGIWPALKASCILAGARTLAGALVPLVGTAPTPYNFDLVTDTDYNRKTGLKGDGSTKYLDSNRAGNADPQNSAHAAVYATTANSGTRWYMGSNNAATGSSNFFSVSGTATQFRSRNASASTARAGTNVPGMIGQSRNLSASYVTRANGANVTVSQASETPDSANWGVYLALGYSPAGAWGNARLSFYSIGESLDLALLDARVTDLMNAIGAAIP